MASKKRDNATLLGITSFLNDVGSEMIAPWIPQFIAMMGGGPEIIGLVNGIHKGFHNLVIYPSGYLSDKIKNRKTFLYTGYSTSAFAKILMAIAKTPLLVVVFSILDRIGKGIRTAPRDVILSGYKEKERGKAFGIQMALDKAGALTGALLGMILVSQFHWDFRLLFMIAGAISLISILPIKYVSEVRVNNKRANDNLERSWILLGTFYSLSLLGYMFFLMKLQTHGAFVAGMSYVLFNLANTVGPFLSGKLIDKGKLRIQLGISIFGLLGAYLIYALTTSLGMLILGIVLFGLGSSMINVGMRTKLSFEISDKTGGQSFGLFNTIVGIGTLTTNVLAGFLWKTNPELSFMYGVATTTILGIYLTAKYFRNSK